MFDLTGKVIIVTGATSGLGYAASKALASQGAKVVLAGRREERGKAVEEEIKNAGGEAYFVKTDVSDKKQIKALVDAAVSKYGRLDCAVNNAGIAQPYTPLHELDDDFYDQIINVNLTSVFYSMKYEIPEILKVGGGSIVNIASIGGLRGTPGMCLYNSTKAAVIGLTKGAAMDYAKLGIRVNAVCPGATESEIFAGVSDDMQKAIAETIPTGRFGKAEEIAALVVSLCSDEMKNITGTKIVADNGQSSMLL